MAKQKLNIQRQQFPTTSVFDSYNNLLGVQDNHHFIDISLSLLDEVEEQPFPINESKIQQIADSIENVGVLEPLIVVKNSDRYQILSGRHRFRACQLLKKDTVPCYVKDVSDDIARYILIATNTDRNNEYAPSVYARAYAEQMELMKKLGKKTVSAIAEQNGVSRKQIYRYIRLTYLNNEFLNLVDNGTIAFQTGVELSYLNELQQNILMDFMNEKKMSLRLLTLEIAQRFHKVISDYENQPEKFKNDIEEIFLGKAYINDDVIEKMGSENEKIISDKEKKQSLKDDVLKVEDDYPKVPEQENFEKKSISEQEVNSNLADNNIDVKQQEEIQKIKERKITVKLSDTDCERISELCGSHSITVGELLANFIGDLVEGTYTNGSDERMYAQKYFERCWFGTFSETTLLSWLLDMGYDVYNDFLEVIEEIEEGYAELENYKINPNAYIEEEIEFLKTDLNDWETELAEIKSNFLKENNKTDWEREIENVNQWWKEKERMIDIG